MGHIEFDRVGSQDVSSALEQIVRDMNRAKATFLQDVKRELGVDKWQGQSKDQFDHAMYLIEDALDDLTTKVRSANNVFCEMGETIRRADVICADWIS